MSLVEIYCIPRPYSLGQKFDHLLGTVEISIHQFTPLGVPRDTFLCVPVIPKLLKTLLPFVLLLWE